VKLLFVTPQLPWPPTQGTALRNFHLMEAAAGEHEVDLLSFVEGDPHLPGEVQIPAALRQVCRRIETVPVPVRRRAVRVRDLVLGWADMERRLWSPAFAARLDALLAETAYDAVQLEGFEVAPYLLGPEALRREAYGDMRKLPKIVFDDHNAEYELQASAARIDAARPQRWPRALYSLIQAKRLRRREALYACAADLCLVVSAEDGAALEAIAPGVGALVVPNGVDCAALPAPRPAPTPAIFFAGKLDYRPNVDACEWLVQEIVPRVRRHVPNVRVVLAGRNPSPAVQRLAGDGVEVTGALDDATMVRRRGEAWVYAVPMRMGSGVRFKVLEAMAAGVPLVCTTLGASGTGARDGSELLVADSAEAFAEATTSLLLNGERRAALAAAAQRLADETHDWRHIAPKVLGAYRALLGMPASIRMPVSVIATVRNERESVARLVETLEAQERAPDEIVVVDGGSTDGTAQHVCALSNRVAVHERPGANISAGRNTAVSLAQHETIAATDAGTALHPAWLARLVAPLEVSESLRATSGFFVSAPLTAWERALGATTLPEVEEIDPARFLPSSRSVAFRREAWAAAGKYPEWLDYCEDLLFDFGLIKAGARPRWVPRAVVRFRPRPTPLAFFKQYYRYARGDGKALLWTTRHAVRYGTYAGGAWLAWLSAARGSKLAAALLLCGGAVYLKAPFLRLSHQVPSPGDFALAAPQILLARLVGDVAKMLGYPAGLLWRLKHPQRSRS
jgi:polysaccharide biosynthesis protein PslH